MATITAAKYHSEYVVRLTLPVSLRFDCFFILSVLNIHLLQLTQDHQRLCKALHEL